MKSLKLQTSFVGLFCRVQFVALSLSCGVLASLPAAAAEDVDREFEYATKLVELGLPDYAQTVVDRVVAANPSEKDRGQVIRASALVLLGDLKTVEDILSKMPPGSPKAQAIKLAMADRYYQMNEMAKCDTIYREFFNQYTNKAPDDKDLLRFYQTAAMKYGQMLERKEDFANAANVYDNLIPTLTDTFAVRQVKVLQSELLLKAAGRKPAAEREPLLRRAESNCTEVTWGGMDLWFGRAATCLANVEIIRGQKDKATKILQKNLTLLKSLDASLKEQGMPMEESPYAGGRSLLGALYRDEADVLTGTPAQRQGEALRYLESAVVEYQDIWTLIDRINLRDTALRAQEIEAKAKETSLTGKPAERQQPFKDLAAALKVFADTLEKPGAEPWDAAVAARATALKDKVSVLIKLVEDAPKEVGVTPSADMGVGDDFKGKEHFDRALAFLQDTEKRKQGAIDAYSNSLKQYYTVFVDYSQTFWAKEAGQKIEQLKVRLEELTGKKITIELPKGGQSKVALVTLREADDLFVRKEYDKAAGAYLQGLAEAPEDKTHVLAVGNLMECYARLKDTLRFKVAALYLAERFKSQPDAPLSLLRLGKLYYDETNRVMYTYAYELYLQNFPQHPTAATILYTLGEQRWKADDYEGAVPYYTRILKGYPSTPFYLKSLDRIGWSYFLNKDYTNAVQTFVSCIETSRPGLVRARSKLCMADSYWQMGDYPKALQNYRELTQWLLEKDSVYVAATVAEEKKEYRTMLERGVFFQAYSLSRLTSPTNKIPTFRKASIQLFRGFVQQFPESELAPGALASLGAVLFSDNQAAEAAKAYEELAKKYPKSEAGQNARFAMIRSLVDIGQTARAKETLKDMLANAASYPVDHFLRVGLMMLDKAEYESAALAFEETVTGLGKLPADSKQRPDMEQRTLIGLGRALYETGSYEKSVKTLNDLVTKYPKSGLFYDARFLLAKAYRKMNKTTEAMTALKDIFGRATDQNLINRATIELAEVQELAGQPADALASCERLILLGDADNAATRPLYEQALLQSLRLRDARSEWKNVVENSDRYIASFPAGKSLQDVRKWRAKALAKLAGEGGKIGG